MWERSDVPGDGPFYVRRPEWVLRGAGGSVAALIRVSGFGWRRTTDALSWGVWELDAWCFPIPQVMPLARAFEVARETCQQDFPSADLRPPADAIPYIEWARANESSL